MLPRNPGYCAVLAFLALILLGSTFSPLPESARAMHAAAGGVTKGFCASDPSGPVFYVSNIFDAVTKARTQISTLPLGNAFYYHLVEQYDYKNRSHLPAHCAVFETLSQAEGRRSQLVSEAQRGNKRVVEVNWDPSPIVEVPQGDGASIGPNVPPPTHTVCAIGHQSTMYFSAVFRTVGVQPDPKWNDAFNDFLRKNYAAEGEANCTTMNTAREAEQLLKDRIGGVRANNRKAVETGWRYNASLVITKVAPKPTPKVDDDPEPAAQRPAPPPPSADIRQFATKEVPLALAACQNDRMLSGAFDCYCIQRTVYNYRIKQAQEHPGLKPEPLETLMAGTKLDCSSCISPYVDMWARSQAQSRSLQLPVAECVAKKFGPSLQAKPYPNHIAELFNGAIAACKK